MSDVDYVFIVPAAHTLAKHNGKTVSMKIEVNEYFDNDAAGYLLQIEDNLKIREPILEIKPR